MITALAPGERPGEDTRTQGYLADGDVAMWLRAWIRMDGLLGEIGRVIISPIDEIATSKPDTWGLAKVSGLDVKEAGILLVCTTVVQGGGDTALRRCRM